MGKLEGQVRPMERPPTVSIVTIFLNAQPFLTQAIESVLAQDYTDWELLLVDDGSSDGSERVARGFAQYQPHRMRYLQHPSGENRGMSASRNLGVAHARGRYIAMLDADDVWLPGILSHQVQILEQQSGPAMVYGPVERWHSWQDKSVPAATRSGKRDLVAYPLPSYDHVINPPMLVPHILQTPLGVPLGVLMRKEAVAVVGGYEESFRGLCEDMVFFSKFCLRHRVYVTSKCLYRYRQHDESAVAAAGREGKRRDARIAYLSWLRDYCTANHVDHAQVWSALRRETLRFRRPRLHGLIRRLSHIGALAVRALPQKRAPKDAAGLKPKGRFLID
jgi:glycosyltransferase involved in cell wall biosynthesis